MSQFFSKYKFLIIGVVIIMAIFIVYGILKPRTSDDPTISKTVVSGKPIDTNGLITDSTDDSFVLQLLAIQSINFNTDFFKDPVYKALKDQNRSLGERPVGRPNPFLPIGEDANVVRTNSSSTPSGGFQITGSDSTDEDTAKPTVSTSTRPTGGAVRR